MLESFNGILFRRKVHITKQTYDLITKPYNIAPVDTGSTSEILEPYNVTTFLISPDLPQVSI